MKLKGDVCSLSLSLCLCFSLFLSVSVSVSLSLSFSLLIFTAILMFLSKTQKFAQCKTE